MSGINELIKRSDNTDKKIDALAKSTDKKIEVLSISVAAGFEGIDKRLIILEKGQKGLSQKINGLNNRFDDFAFNKATKDEVYKLSKRVDKLYKPVGLELVNT